MLENFRVKVFRAVAEEESFRKASERLHLSQPAVSQHVHALEEELGIRLFDRSGGHVALTPGGVILLKHAREAESAARKAEAELAELAGETAGELSVGASTTVAQYVLPRLLGAFMRDHKGIVFGVTSGNTEEVVGWLEAERIHLGLIEGPALSRSVQTERVLEDRMILIAPRDSQWNGADKTREAFVVKDLESLPLLMRERGSGSRHVVEAALKRAGVKLRELRVVMELDSTEAIVSGVEAGLGVGFVSEWAVGKELELGTLAAVEIRGLVIRRDFLLARRSGEQLDGAASAFRRFVLAQGRRNKRTQSAPGPSGKPVPAPRRIAIRKSNSS